MVVAHLGSLKHGVMEENMAELQMDLTVHLSTEQLGVNNHMQCSFYTHFDSSTSATALVRFSMTSLISAHSDADL